MASTYIVLRGRHEAAYTPASTADEYEWARRAAIGAAFDILFCLDAVTAAR